MVDISLEFLQSSQPIFHHPQSFYHLRKIYSALTEDYKLVPRIAPLLSTKSMLSIDKCTFINQTKFSLAVSESYQFTRRSCKMEGSSTIELDGKDAFVDTSTTIDRQIHFGLHAAIEFIASPFHEIGSDRGMVADLFEVNWAAINPTLIGLAKNGVEWLFHCQVNQRTSQHSAQNSLQLVNWTSLDDLLEENRAVAEGHCLSFDIALSAENIYGQRNVQNAFACEYIFAYSFDDKGQHPSLLPHLFLIDIVQSSRLSLSPLSSPQMMTSEFFSKQRFSFDIRLNSMLSTQVQVGQNNRFIRIELRWLIFHDE